MRETIDQQGGRILDLQATIRNLTTPTSQPTASAEIEQAIRNRQIIKGMTIGQASRSLGTTPEVVSDDEDGKTYEWKVRVQSGRDITIKYLDAVVAGEKIDSFRWDEETAINAVPKDPPPPRRTPTRDYRFTEGIPGR